MGILETTIRLDGETINIYRFGTNDYSAEFEMADCSVRGTLLDIMMEISAAYDLDEDILVNQ